MREKKLQWIVTFETTTQAMAFEEKAKAMQLEGRLIPLPRAIGAGCGLSWKEPLENKKELDTLILSEALEYDKIHEAMV